MELITSEENGNSNITYWMFFCKNMGHWCWDYHHSTLDTGDTTMLCKKKNKKSKKKNACALKGTYLSVLGSFYSSFAVLRYRSVRIFPFYFSIEIMLDGEWKQRRNSTWIIISGAISIRFQDERKNIKMKRKFGMHACF